MPTSLLDAIQVRLEMGRIVVARSLTQEQVESILPELVALYAKLNFDYRKPCPTGNEIMKLLLADKADTIRNKGVA